MASKKMRGTCSVCFGNHDVDRVSKKNPGGSVHKHGWRETGGRTVGQYGNTWHTGQCHGVGFPAFELSPRGTWSAVETMIFPHAVKVSDALARFRTRPVLTVSYKYDTGATDNRTGRRVYDERKATVSPGAPAVEVSTGSADWQSKTIDYEDEIASRIAACEAELEATRADGLRLYDAAAAWTEGTLTAKAAKVAAVHYQRAGARAHYCAGFRFSGCAATTTDAAAVTCSKCAKGLAREAAESAKRAGEIADGEALAAWLKQGPASAKEIKAALSWDTRRLNRAADRADREVTTIWATPALYTLRG